MFDAGSLLFRIQTVGKQIFVQDQGDAKQAVEKTGKAAQTAAGQVDSLGSSTDKAGKKAKDSKAPLDEQAKSTKKVGDENAAADPKIKKTTASTEQQIESAKRLSAAMLIAGTAVAAMVSLAVVKNTEFDAAMSNVRASTMATAAEQRELGEAALDAGADTAYSASEAAAAEEELAKAGLSVAEVVGGSLNGALALAAAGQLQVARSAEIMATTLTQFRLPAEQAAHVSDVLAAGAGKAQGSVDDLALALSYVGPIAGSVGFSLNETAGTIAYLATQGIIGEKAGTSLRGVLASLQAPSAIANKEMEKYSISMFDANGNMLSMAGIAEQLRTRLGGLTEQERLAALGRIFGNESLNAATLLYEGGASEVNKWTAAVDDSGYAAEQAAIRQDNLAGDIEKLGGAFDTALIRTGTSANDVLRTMVQGLTELVDMYGEAPEPIQATALVLGVATAAVLLFAGGAVGARAKFLELKIALDATTTSMGKTAVMGGIAGIALTGVLAVVAGLMAAQADARARAESYADALRQTGSAADEAARDIVAANLSTKESFLWMESDSAYDAAKKLGIGIDLVTDAAEGNAAAQAKLAKEMEFGGLGTEEFDKKLEDLGISLTDYQALSTTVTQAVERESAARDEGRKLIDQQKEATDGAATSSQTAAEAYIAEADSVEDLNSKLSTLIETINEANGVGQDAVTANADYQQTLFDVSEQIANIRSGVEGFGRGLDLTTQAGIDNSNMLVKMAQDSQDAAQAQLDLDGNTEAYLARLTDGRQKIIDSAIAMGATEEAAILLADSIYRIPSEKEIAILAETTAAQQDVDQFVTLNNGRRVKVFVDAETGNQSFKVGSKTVSAEADGSVRYFASGGTVPENHVAEIARAGEYRVWAEDETGGESYIPHAKSKLPRSEQIMTETARILGGQYIPAGARSFADGGTIGASSAPADIRVILQSKGGIDLLQYIDVKVEQGATKLADSAWGA
jgi:TP901 family phage tail tape measure protein